MSDIDLEALRSIFGHLLDRDEDPRIDLPLEEQVRLLVDWACSPRPDNFRRSIPVKATDHDILICGALAKLVKALSAAGVPA